MTKSSRRKAVPGLDFPLGSRINTMVRISTLDRFMTKIHFRAPRFPSLPSSLAQDTAQSCILQARRETLGRRRETPMQGEEGQDTILRSLQYIHLDYDLDIQFEGSICMILEGRGNLPLLPFPSKHSWVTGKKGGSWVDLPYVLYVHRYMRVKKTSAMLLCSLKYRRTEALNTGITAPTSPFSSTSSLPYIFFSRSIPDLLQL